MRWTVHDFPVDPVTGQKPLPPTPWPSTPFNYRSITSIVTNNLDRSQPTQSPTTTAIVEHSNLRGRTYFN